MPSNTQEDDTTDMEQQQQPHNISLETWPEAIAPEPLTGHLGAHFRGDGLSAGVQVMGISPLIPGDLSMTNLQ